MPDGLQPVAYRGKYPCLFGTLSPMREEWGEAILNWIVHHFRDVQPHIYHPDLPSPRLKFEISNKTMCPHFHLGLYFTEPIKVDGFINRMQKYLARYKHDKPAPYNKELNFSFRLFIVPFLESINGKVLRGATLINTYLDNPTKLKSTDGVNFSVQLDNFNVGAHIIALRSIPGPYWDPGQNVRQSKADEAYAKAYFKYSRKHDLPEISWTIVANKPDLKELAKKWARPYWRNLPYKNWHIQPENYSNFYIS